jgi:hypothetical protein
VIPDPSPPFELGASGAIRERMQRMVGRAAALGVQSAVAQAFGEILERLVSRPREWGDPLRHFRNAQTTQYAGHHRKFRCVYSVHDRVPIVFLTDIYPMPGNPLYGETFDG